MVRVRRGMEWIWCAALLCRVEWGLHILFDRRHRVPGLGRSGLLFLGKEGSSFIHSGMRCWSYQTEGPESDDFSVKPFVSLQEL